MFERPRRRAVPAIGTLAVLVLSAAGALAVPRPDMKLMTIPPPRKPFCRYRTAVSDPIGRLHHQYGSRTGFPST